ncbi:MAG: N-acetyltransferase [Paraglaciecola sp.]|nr:N-acetyltransferase [Paraglaciecola sp.]NCT46618.1 N-acetyltransferase [Paraglaciecola sp.]
MKDAYSHQFVHSIEQIGRDTWQACAAFASPLCQYSFLHAIEASGSVGANTGWSPSHLIIFQHKRPVAILPLYKKTHSYGEYVFDFAWANTYRQYGLNYYPKLICAIPFTPVTGPRILSVRQDLSAIVAYACKILDEKLIAEGLSSMHWLFVDNPLSELLQAQQQLMRLSVQFQWYNRNYTSFDEFLLGLNARKRKSIRAERRKVDNQGIVIKRMHGAAIMADDMDFFYQCYQQTYLKRSGHQGYLNQAFFTQLLSSMSDNLLLVLAYRDNCPLAGALFLYDQHQLNGRYWGAIEDIDQLHFECCYYQGIEFCIEQNISCFNPGTQGEHKILRGFEPTYCYSNHHLKELAFHDAVSRFIDSETPEIQAYKQDADKLLPFRKSSGEESDD